MAGLVESIFDSKKKLNDFFPYSPDVKYFDLHRKHFLYGRIDRSGDAVMVEETNLKATRSGGKSTNLALNFVSDAFQDFRNYYRARVNTQDLDASSVYSSDILVKKAYKQGDIEYSYHHYKNKLYDEFTNSYLKKDRKHEKIIDFRSFCSAFMKYFSENAYYFPITKTGYILSQHCPPYVSGLMIEIAPGAHGVQNNIQITQYVTDPNFGFIRAESRKFGFMVDINAPWRLVFNVASGFGTTGNTTPASSGDDHRGGKKYLSSYGLDFDNVFNFYYIKTHMEDLYNLKDLLLKFYTAYYLLNRTYERLEYVRPAPGADCLTKKITLTRKDKAPPPLFEDLDSQEYDEYFTKYLLLARMHETNHEDINKYFKIASKELIESKRNLGNDASLNYINNLTKGAPVSKFLRKGKYWYGVSDDVYRQRLQQEKVSFNSTNSRDTIVTGTKGKTT